MQVVGCKVLPIFLMPDEKHLGGFSQMDFHIISCVIWMNVVEWLMFMWIFAYLTLLRLHLCYMNVTV